MVRLSKAKLRIVDQARRAGFTVRESVTCVMVYRSHPNGHTTCGVVLYEDGTALDITVRADLAKNLTLAGVRATLGLKEAK